MLAEFVRHHRAQARKPSDALAGDLESGVQDAERSQPHRVGMLCIVWVEERDENSEQLFDRGQAVRLQIEESVGHLIASGCPRRRVGSAPLRESGLGRRRLRCRLAVQDWPSLAPFERGGCAAASKVYRSRRRRDRCAPRVRSVHAQAVFRALTVIRVVFRRDVSRVDRSRQASEPLEHRSDHRLHCPFCRPPEHLWKCARQPAATKDLGRS